MQLIKKNNDGLFRLGSVLVIPNNLYTTNELTGLRIRLERIGWKVVIDCYREPLESVATLAEQVRAGP